jgi:hypothetical protein
VIYSPAVVVFRDNDGKLLETPFTCSFLTAPAPNAGAVFSGTQSAGINLAGLCRQESTRFSRLRLDKVMMRSFWAPGDVACSKRPATCCQAVSRSADRRLCRSIQAHTLCCPGPFEGRCSHRSVRGRLWEEPSLNFRKVHRFGISPVKLFGSEGSIELDEKPNLWRGGAFISSTTSSLEWSRSPLWVSVGATTTSGFGRYDRGQFCPNQISSARRAASETDGSRPAIKSQSR